MLIIKPTSSDLQRDYIAFSQQQQQQQQQQKPLAIIIIAENSYLLRSSRSYGRRPTSFGYEEEIPHLEHTGGNASGILEIVRVVHVRMYMLDRHSVFIEFEFYTISSAMY